MDNLDSFIALFRTYYLQLTISLILVIIYSFSKSIFRKVVKRHALKHQFHYSREIYVRKLINMSLALVLITVIGAIWEISFQGLSFYFASIFTIVGVALFANWSILSNLTASVIIFFFLPYKVGDTIKVVDGESSVTGIIRDIGLFQIVILTDDKRQVAYFNNLFLQKPIEFLGA
ncbi:MAG: MscS family membrane protein [Cyclobacteriaceae bacterium]|jgi:MscS family membrane protein